MKFAHVAASFLLAASLPAFSHCPQPPANRIRICWQNPTTRESGAKLNASEIKSIQIYLDGVLIKSVTNRWYIEQGYTEYKPACYKAGAVITGTVTDTNGLKSRLSVPFILPAKQGTVCQ